MQPHVLIGTERPRRGRFDGSRFTRWLRRPDRRTSVAAAPQVAAPAPRPTQVDAATRSFWAGSETANVTSRRAAALVDAHERGRAPIGSRPPGNPAFSEALFVELDGRDLIEAGYQPGPQFSQMLAAAEDAQLEGTIHSREEALALIKENWPYPERA